MADACRFMPRLQGGHPQDTRQARSLMDRLVEQSVLRARQKAERGSARVRGNGERIQGISNGTQLSVVIGPCEQHGALEARIRKFGAFPRARNGHVRPLLPTVRFGAIVDVEDEWSQLSEMGAYESQFPHRMCPRPVVSTGLGPVPFVSRFARGAKSPIRDKTIAPPAPVMGVYE